MRDAKRPLGDENDRQRRQEREKKEIGDVSCTNPVAVGEALGQPEGEAAYLC